MQYISEERTALLYDIPVNVAKTIINYNISKSVAISFIKLTGK